MRELWPHRSHLLLGIHTVPPHTESSVLGSFQELVRQGAVTAAELETAVATRFNPVRVSFKGGKEMWVRDVLSTGVSPRWVEHGRLQLVLEAWHQFW